MVSYCNIYCNKNVAKYSSSH